MMMGMSSLQKEYSKFERRLEKARSENDLISKDLNSFSAASESNGPPMSPLEALHDNDTKLSNAEWEVVDKTKVIVIDENEVSKKRVVRLERGLDDDSYTLAELAPEIFSSIRKLFELSDEDYWCSIDPGAFASGILGAKWQMPESLSSSGRSGSFIYKTADNFLVIKSLPPSEAKRCLALLLDYYRHLEKNKDSLLTRFYGLYELSASGGASFFFVVMENAILSPKPLHELYDLKGSTVNRSVPVELRKAGMALKDVDLDQNRRRVLIGEDKKKKLIEQAKKDAQFLCDHNGLDYSLLLGIIFDEKAPLKRTNSSSLLPPSSLDSNNPAVPLHDENGFGSSAAPSFHQQKIEGEENVVEEEEEEEELSIYPHSYRSSFQQEFGGLKTNLIGTETYFYIGIIVILSFLLLMPYPPPPHHHHHHHHHLLLLLCLDMLTEWDISKISEHMTKTMVLSQDKEQISAVRPSLYFDRFVQYLDRLAQ